MTIQPNRSLLRRLVVFTSIAAVLLCGAPRDGSAETMTRDDFVPIARDGFGDRQNSFAWSTRWWKDKLYVGTSRSNYCVQQATIVRFLPQYFFLYPPSSAIGFECTDSPQDLSLAAEIWCYDPSTGVWDSLFQSPEDVPIPGHPGKIVARDTGFRTMTPFTEQDGTEALYVGGICSQSINPGVPPPRLLRSTDGQTFEPVPQDAGTFLGSLTVDGQPFNGFRSLQVYDGRLFSIASEGFNGYGALIESANPEQGNDAFHFAAPELQVFYQLASYNGYLYAGVADEDGFVLVKTDAQGTPPYDFDVVIPAGGHLATKPSQAVVSMFEYEGRLYVGTDRPAEIYRVNPDNSWELVAGEPRTTPTGRMRPLSGMDAGLGNPYALHIWRMQSAYGTLYTGTMDQTTKWADIWPGVLDPVAGFDLYTTRNGHYYSMVTRNGFVDKYDEGLRQFAFHPEHGLIVGSSNLRYGCNLWQGVPDPDRIPPPLRVEGELVNGSYVLLTWRNVPEASTYHVYRAALGGTNRKFVHVGATKNRYFVDAINLASAGAMHYYITAEDASGSKSKSGPSNTVRMPTLGDVATFLTLRRHIAYWNVSADLLADLDDVMGSVFWERNFSKARKRLQAMRTELLNNPEMLDPSWRAEDVEILLSKLERRVYLAENGVLPWWRLFL